MQRLTAVCITGREYEIKDSARVPELYCIWEFARWEPSNSLKKQILAELTVMPDLCSMLQIEMNLVQFSANSDTTRDGWNKGDCESPLSEIRDIERDQLPSSILIAEQYPLSWQMVSLMFCLSDGGIKVC